MAPTTPDFGPQIDDYAPSQPARVCDPQAKPGLLAFRDLVLASYPGTRSMGISRECGKTVDSEHKEGRAWDWGVDLHTQGHIASDLIDWLLATDRHGNPHALVRRFGIMYIIWNRRIWESYRPNAGWTPYTGVSPHTDHVHFSFSWAGARKQTSWWQTPAGPTRARVGVGVPSVVDHGAGMVVFGVDASGGVVHRWQNVAGGAWSAWTGLGGPPGGAVGRPWALVGRYGKLAVFVRGADGALWHTWQSEAGAWAPEWVSLGGRLAGDPSVVLSPNNALSVFARDPEGRVTHTWQRGAEHGYAWHESWADMEGSTAGRLSVLVGRDGGMVLFARGADGGLHHRWQTGTGGPWSGWTPLGGRLAGDPSVVLSPNNALSVFARDPEGRVTHTWQRGAEHGYAWHESWADMGGAVLGRPMVLVGRDGGMVLFARGTDGGLHHRWQTGTGGPWSGWSPLGGRLSADPAVVLNPSGDLSVFGRDPDGRMTHTWQRGPQHGHAWNDTWVDMEGNLAADPPHTALAAPALPAPPVGESAATVPDSVVS
ncbi:hypothetical protein [Streptomyces ficellus]|uniref:Uncharacterized protein n=1 Tax=Streptomyces ficellus TaxID=1977088 RepID=A0A6I6F3S7_9ACTN|nr:hypothetical protein [Streptomyces ficellus]QGV77334.1 hypothetical protein EIZ62_02995 [Streptomyces ficellus]